MKILVVDDHEESRELLEKMLRAKGYDVVAAENGADALKKLQAGTCDLIISDILMPIMDGYQFCREVKGDENFRNIPFVFYTAAYTERKDKELALSLGVERFIPKPIDRHEFLNIIQGLINDVSKGTLKPKKVSLGDKEDDLLRYSERLVEKYERKMAALEQEIRERKRAEEAITRDHERLRQAFEGTIRAVAKAVEARDLYIAGHQRRVAKLACAIAHEIGLNTEQLEGINLGATIHDIGKIHLPAEILGKPALLEDTEYELIKGHPEVGYKILKDIDFPWPIAEIAHQHHEHLDGSGYPQGLVGDAIILEARIVAVADVVEAMACHRPYRPGLGIDAALAELEKHKGKYYDPKIVDACQHLLEEKKFSFETA
jgi:putative nucleotidyltransferase with HDIG domain